ncbi:MAG: uroporphyrinogen decarboxylase family protein [Oscillospiraceae bacterium]|nr:uroporphyrinogen decarboxylase family protein [Oscillospiraceae bacterium]
MMAMTQRERFLKTAGFGNPDRAFLCAPWGWGETWERWVKEGLSTDNVCEYFGTDAERCVPLTVQGPYGPHLAPPFEVKLISETDDYIIERDGEGNTVKVFKNDRYRSMPQWLKYPMATREDWENEIKPRLDAKTPGRRPAEADWRPFAEGTKNRDYALGIWCGSLYGWPRSFMGVENMSYMIYDDPALVHEMCEHIADFIIELITPVLREVELDFAFIWEDMAGKSGPLCSPGTYREFMAGPLKRIVAMLHKYNVRNIIVDSDGNNDVLIPVWLECGVNGLRPFEIAANCDPVKTRRIYGKELIIQGGIDKRALALEKEDIDREVLSKVPWLCMQGGFFPQVDHLTPPDVSLENITYYSKLLRAVTEDPEHYLWEAEKRGFWQ